MSVIVQKYGGSSVADLSRVREVARRIVKTVREGHRVVVVVSAMGNTTNELIALARELTPRPDRRELDMLISVGERIAMALLAMALREEGVPAVSLTGSQSGIITDEAHADARVVEVRPARVLKHLDEGLVVIVAGFQGVSRSREVTTLGRGGSDTTAVVLAAALEADYCEICSDVDGVWSADPRVVSDAQPLATLSLDEGLALARGGAKVLFEDALRYARDHGVVLQASATSGPGAGTRLSPEGSTTGGASSVTLDTQLQRVRLDVASAAAIRQLVAGGARVRRRIGHQLWLDMRNAHGGLPELPGLSDEGPASVLSAVGSNLGERVDLALAVEEALGDAVVQAGSEADTLWWEVERERGDWATQTVHALLVTGSGSFA